MATRPRCYSMGGFLSTLSLRRATISCAWSASKLGDFYPRSPCGERRSSKTDDSYKTAISIHALLAESDLRHCTTYLNCSLFLSTLSLRRATAFVLIIGKQSRNFYPRSPCGERHVWAYPDGFGCLFLSTLSLRRATRCQALDISTKRISIHALLAESDSYALFG